MAGNQSLIGSTQQRTNNDPLPWPKVFRGQGRRWIQPERMLPARAANAIKNQCYEVLQKQEKKMLMDTTTMLNVCERLREGEAIPEIYFGDEGMGAIGSVLVALSF
jgi:hypothetical protein